MNEITHFSDVLLKHAKGGGVGEHHGCQTRLVFIHLKERRRFLQALTRLQKQHTVRIKMAAGSHSSSTLLCFRPEITPVIAQLYVWTKLFTQDPAAVLPNRDSLVSIKTRGVRVFSNSHQGPEVRQVDVAIFVHFHHLHLHAGHLSARWVGAVRRLGDQTHLE